MLEVKKLKDFMKERGIQEGEQFALYSLIELELKLYVFQSRKIQRMMQ